MVIVALKYKIPVSAHLRAFGEYQHLLNAEPDLGLEAGSRPELCRLSSVYHVMPSPQHCLASLTNSEKEEEEEDEEEHV
jgi:hypothetical protein